MAGTNALVREVSCPPIECTFILVGMPLSALSISPASFMHFRMGVTSHLRTFAVTISRVPFYCAQRFDRS